MNVSILDTTETVLTFTLFEKLCLILMKENFLPKFQEFGYKTTLDQGRIESRLYVCL